MNKIITYNILNKNIFEGISVKTKKEIKYRYFKRGNRLVIDKLEYDSDVVIINNTKRRLNIDLNMNGHEVNVIGIKEIKGRFRIRTYRLDDKKHKKIDQELDTNTLEMVLKDSDIESLDMFLTTWNSYFHDIIIDRTYTKDILRCIIDNQEKVEKILIRYYENKRLKYAVVEGVINERIRSIYRWYNILDLRNEIGNEIGNGESNVSTYNKYSGWMTDWIIVPKLGISNIWIEIEEIYRKQCIKELRDMICLSRDILVKEEKLLKFLLNGGLMFGVHNRKVEALEKEIKKIKDIISDEQLEFGKKSNSIVNENRRIHRMLDGSHGYNKEFTDNDYWNEIPYIGAHVQDIACGIVYYINGVYTSKDGVYFIFSDIKSQVNEIIKQLLYLKADIFNKYIETLKNISCLKLKLLKERQITIEGILLQKDMDELQDLVYNNIGYSELDKNNI